jgi:succinate-semialdehyde dehydrogenase / glutarate-semialdehyde dehydrogenase
MSAQPAIARLFIDGTWREATEGDTTAVVNPATGSEMGRVCRAGPADLDAALDAAARGFAIWRNTSAYDRAMIIRRAVDLIRTRKADIARVMTLEQGKPLAEAEGEIATSADNTEWMAEEALHACGRVLPRRSAGIDQIVRRDPVGPVAAFCPWNFPALTPMRKIGGALAAGCSIIVKPSEETPFTAVALVQAFEEAGVPPGVVNLVFGRAATVSQHLIASPIIRKITFTGSTPVGKLLLAQAAEGVKRATMELGGHAPVVVYDDVDVQAAAKLAVTAKFRNAGQVCTSPTRFYVQSGIYRAFVDAFRDAANNITVGDGLAAGTQMGPVANARGVETVERLVANARDAGARLECGGARIGDRGSFYQPTVLSDVPDTARIMSEEPFGPVAPIAIFDNESEVRDKVNGLPFGLAAYVMTRSLKRATEMSEALEAGMVVVNGFTVSTPASPFGGVKQSGYGSEGGSEGLESYLVTKSITTRFAGADLDPTPMTDGAR